VSDGAQELELAGGGRVLFSGRAEGNMSSVGGDRAEEGSLAREHLRARIGVRGLARGYQVHGNAVMRVASIPESDADVPSTRADGQATALAGVGAMVLTADCLPVALGVRGAVAMLHAGWRGLAGGILEQGVLALRELELEDEAGRPGAIVAVIGPGAGACCYEVGEEVHAAFPGAPRRGRKIDLRAIARERLTAAGVSDVRDVDACTICDERYFSHRREGAHAGRQAGVAWLS
jgi:YfiH family protein